LRDNAVVIDIFLHFVIRRASKDHIEHFRRAVAGTVGAFPLHVVHLHGGADGTTPYFLLDNDKYVHLDRFKATKLQKFTVDSRKEYLQHDKEQWKREYFNKENGGYLLVDRERIAHSKISKNERAKFDKEYEMAKVFAQNGYKVEMLKEIPGVSSSDVLINGISVDLKRVSGHKNIAGYAKKAIRKQGAEIVLFEFNVMTHDIQDELVKLKKLGINVKYFITGGNKVINL
jgi:hypothetical protein